MTEMSPLRRRMIEDMTVRITPPSTGGLRRMVTQCPARQPLRCRRLARDFEATVTSATAWLFLAHIRLLTRKIARHR